MLVFSKVFGKVPYTRLINKLRYLMVFMVLCLLDFSLSFLTNHSQSVVCNGKRSQPAPITPGVPQGESSVMLFAGNALLYGVTSSEEETDQLHDDLQQLEIWQLSKWYSSPPNVRSVIFPPRKHHHRRSRKVNKGL